MLACRYGTIGRCYILGGEDCTLQFILTEIAQLAQRSPPRVRIPQGLVYPLAWIAEACARLPGGAKPIINRDSPRMARKKMYFCSDRAITELGYSYRPAREALQDAVNWFLARSFCALRDCRIGC